MNTAVVVGGGSVGLCVAEALASRGVAVTTLERDRCGMGASAGNAGWLTPSLAVPIPGPGVIAQSLRWLINPSGPLWIRPTLSPPLLEWIAQFVVNCRRGPYRRGLALLQTAATRGAASFDRLAERGAQYELHSHELLYPAFSDAERAQLLGIADDLRRAGAPHPIEPLSGPEMTGLEPALSQTCVGGLIAYGEQRVRPESLSAGVRRQVEFLGASVIEGSNVTALHRDRSEWIASGPSGEWRAESVILANGVAAQTLLRPLGVRLSLAAAKGYSRTFAQTDSGPKRPVYLEHPKVAISVYDGAVRVSGTLELGAQTLALSQRRLTAITAAAREAMPSWQVPAAPADWAGMRSMSPDGLPYVGAIQGQGGLYVATGHATLGITLAPLSGELLAGLMLDGAEDRLLAAFDPGRAVARLTQKTT